MGRRDPRGRPAPTWRRDPAAGGRGCCPRCHSHRRASRPRVSAFWARRRSPRPQWRGQRRRRRCRHRPCIRADHGLFRHGLRAHPRMQPAVDAGRAVGAGCDEPVGHRAALELVEGPTQKFFAERDRAGGIVGVDFEVDGTGHGRNCRWAIGDIGMANEARDGGMKTVGTLRGGAWRDKSAATTGGFFCAICRWAGAIT